jgi:hypothetical protein
LLGVIQVKETSQLGTDLSRESKTTTFTSLTRATTVKFPSFATVENSATINLSKRHR